MSGRIRSIKPEILDDEECCGLSDAAWRLWVSMFVLADDHGNLRTGAKYLAANVWQDTSKSPQVAELLSELERAKRILRYESEGQPYAHIRNWEKHQRIDNAGKARVPTPPDGSPNGKPAINKLADISPRTADRTSGEHPQVSESVGESLPTSPKGTSTEEYQQLVDHLAAKRGESPQSAAYASGEIPLLSGSGPRRGMGGDLDPERAREGQDSPEPDRTPEPASGVVPRMVPRQPVEPLPRRPVYLPEPEASQESPEPAKSNGAQPLPAKPSESPYDLAKRVFCELWETRYRRPYQLSPNLGPKSEHEALRAIGAMAQERGGTEAERFCRHIVGAYLRDSDAKLSEECHPISFLIPRLNKYGEPKKPNPARARQSKPDDSAPPVSLERMQELANMTAKIGAGG